MSPEAAAALTARSREFTLAALAAAYPADALTEVCAALGAELATHPGLGPLCAALAQDPDGVRGEYLDRFDHGKERVPLYETEYGRMRGLAKGKDLADVMGFYNAFGFELAGEPAAEPPDHVAIELEFYALLLYKQALLVEDAEGWDIVQHARERFLVDHLGAYLAALAARPTVEADPVYGPVFRWCAALVERECALAQVKPAPLDFFEQDDAATPASCGGCVTIPGMEGR